MQVSKWKFLQKIKKERMGVRGKPTVSLYSRRSKSK